VSNVLIGIIGVILFIGLALAGALFLGDRFSQSSASSEAASVMAVVQQVSNAVELKRLETGSQIIRNGTIASLQPEFLKPGIGNPSKVGVANPNSYLHIPHFNNDALNDAGDEGGTGTARYLMMSIGSDTRAKTVCQAIAKQITGSDELKIIDADNRYPSEQIGCRNGSGQYIVFSQI
jgi:hypothetical protein